MLGRDTGKPSNSEKLTRVRRISVEAIWHPKNAGFIRKSLCNVTFGRISCVSTDRRVALRTHDQKLSVRLGTRTPRRTRSSFGGIPKSRASGADLLRRDRGSPRIPGTCGQKHGSCRIAPQSSLNTRRSRGIPGCNRAAHRCDTTVSPRHLPPASFFAWRCSAHRIRERIALWRSWPGKILRDRSYSLSRSLA